MATRRPSFRIKRNRNPLSPPLTGSRFPDVLRYMTGLVFLLLMTTRPSFGQIQVTVNYADEVNSNGTPLLFGGSNEPNPGDQASFYPQAKTSGVKFQRGSIHVDQVLPQGITLAEFEANTNGVAEPANWNWGPTTWATNAHAQGWTTMANLLNAPTWLTDDGTTGGIPSSWSVWQQIVTAIVEHLGSNLNYIELLNEPTVEIGLAGSPYSSVEAAVDAYYYYGAVAARAGNSNLMIGGDAEVSGNFPTLDSLIEDTSITSNLLQFVSFHSYSSNPASNGIATLESTLSSNGRGGLPIFLTEWNYSIGQSSPEIDNGDQTVNFAAWQLMEMTGQTGLSGASFFSFLPNNEEISSYEDCSGCDNYPFAFYSGTNDVATLLPIARAWQLLSVDLGLGTGTYHTFGTVGATVAEEGWVTSTGAVSAAVSNQSSSATTVNFTLEGIDTSGCNFTVYAYLADTGSNTAVSPVATYNNVCITNGTLTLKGVAIPAYAVLGIIVGGGGGTCTPTAIVPEMNVGGTWTEESSATVSSTTATVDLGPQPLTGGSWSWTGPNGFTSTAREIDGIPLSTGTNVYTATYTNSCGSTSTQAFTITVSGGSSTLIANGTYIITAVNSGLAIDDPDFSKTDGEDLDIYTVNDGTNQQWTVTNLGNNVITLTNGSSGQLVDVAGASQSSGALVDQWPGNGQTNQEWNVISVAGGAFELTSVNSGLALSVIGGGTGIETGLDQLTYSGSTSQQWKFTSY